MKSFTSILKVFLIPIIAVLVFIAAISLAVYLLNQNNPTQEFNRTDIIEVIDGDTFRLDNNETIRLLCVDTPEKGQEGQDDALAFLQSRLLNAGKIRYEGNTSDNYGRLLRWVYVDDVLLNKEIVAYGYGKIFEYEDENCGLMYD